MQKFHTKRSYKRPEVDYTRKPRPSKTIPQQALSIKDILSRFTRNIPVNAPIQTPVYVDQDEFDLEKVTRLPFDEKVRLSDELKARNEQTIADYEEAEKERLRKEKELATPTPSPANQQQPPTNVGGTGIV